MGENFWFMGICLKFFREKKDKWSKWDKMKIIFEFLCYVFMGFNLLFFLFLCVIIFMKMINR